MKNPMAWPRYTYTQQQQQKYAQICEKTKKVVFRRCFWVKALNHAQKIVSDEKRGTRYPVYLYRSTRLIFSKTHATTAAE